MVTVTFFESTFTSTIVIFISSCTNRKHISLINQIESMMQQQSIILDLNLFLTPQKNEYLNAFEEYLYNLVHNIEFERANTVFQNQLNKDINMINKDSLLFIPADKSNNHY